MKDTYIVIDPTYVGEPNPFAFVKSFSATSGFERCHFDNAKKFGSVDSAISFIRECSPRNATKASAAKAKKFVMLFEDAKKKFKTTLSAEDKRKATNAKTVKKVEIKTNCLLVPVGDTTDVWNIVDGKLTLTDTYHEPVSKFKLDTFEAITVIHEGKLMSGYVSDLKTTEIGKLAVSITYRVGGDDYISPLELKEALNSFFNPEMYAREINTNRRAEFFYVLDYSNLSEAITSYVIFSHVVSVLSKYLKCKISEISKDCTEYQIKNLKVVITDTDEIVIVDSEIHDCLEILFS